SPRLAAIAPLIDRTSWATNAPTHRKIATGRRKMVTAQMMAAMFATHTVTVKLKALAAALRTRGPRSREMDPTRGGARKLGSGAVRTRPMGGERWARTAIVRSSLEA